MKNFLLIILSLLLASCSSQNKINILNKNFENYIGIYFLNNDSITIENFKILADKKIPRFKKLDSMDSLVSFDAYYVTVEKDLTSKLDTNTLKYTRLSVDEKIKLSRARSKMFATFTGPTKNTYDKQAKISEFIRELTKDRDVLICDYNSYEWFNSNSWEINRIDNFRDSIKDVVHQITIHVYRDSEFCRAVSIGLNKFGLPEISIKELPCSNQNTYVSLLNAVIQTLAEKPFINSDSTVNIDLSHIKNNVVRSSLRTDLKSNAKEKVRIRLKKCTPEEGDNECTQLSLVFDNGSSVQEGEDYVVSKLFGKSDDIIIHINHDSLLLSVSTKERQRLPELRKMFNNGLAPGYSILVKAPFKIESGGNEWMWVEVTKWTSDSIVGVLQNDPFEIRNLKAGAIVSIKESELFDYILNKPDGTFEGNETGKLIEKINNNGL